MRACGAHDVKPKLHAFGVDDIAAGFFHHTPSV